MKRDTKGKFVKGNTPVNLQDKTTGRFTSNKSVDKYTIAVNEVDHFLKTRGDNKYAG